MAFIRKNISSKSQQAELLWSHIILPFLSFSMRSSYIFCLYPAFAFSFCFCVFCCFPWTYLFRCRTKRTVRCKPSILQALGICFCICTPFWLSDLSFEFSCKDSVLMWYPCCFEISFYFTVCAQKRVKFIVLYTVQHPGLILGLIKAAAALWRRRKRLFLYFLI